MFDYHSQFKSHQFEHDAELGMKNIYLYSSEMMLSNSLGIQTATEQSMMKSQYDSQALGSEQRPADAEEKFYYTQQRYNLELQNNCEVYHIDDIQSENNIDCHQILFTDETHVGYQKHHSGDLYQGSQECKNSNSTSEGSFELQTLGCYVPEDNDKNSNFQKNTNAVFIELNSHSHENPHSTAAAVQVSQQCNQHNNSNQINIPTNHINQPSSAYCDGNYSSYYHNLHSPKYSSAQQPAYFFQGAPSTNQNQKQYLPKHDQKASIPTSSWGGIPSQANLNSQLKEKLFEKLCKASRSSGIKLSNVIGMIESNLSQFVEEAEIQYSQNSHSQIDMRYSNFEEEGHLQNYHNVHSWQAYQQYKLEGCAENAYSSCSKNKNNYLGFNDTDLKDEDLIYDSDKLLQGNLTHIYEEHESCNIPYEVAQNTTENTYGQQQLFQLCREEEHFAHQSGQNRGLRVENQGELTFSSFSQQQQMNMNPSDSGQQNLNQFSKIDEKMFQEQQQLKSNQQINPPADALNNLRQQIYQRVIKNKNEEEEVSFNFQADHDNKAIEVIESCSSIDNSRNHKSSSVSDKSGQEELSENLISSKQTVDQNQDSKTPRCSDDVVEQITHMNKKNIVRNIIRAFKKYFLNKKAAPQAGALFFPEQSLDVTRSQFKQYFVNKKFNNSILKQLIIHPTYGEVFNFFLLNRASEYLDHSNVKTKESHELFISFLVLCCSEPQKLTILETYSKL